jgi:LysM repeat protein
MRRLWMLPLSLCGALLFPSCSSSSGPVLPSGPNTSVNPMGLGPFDARGNYVDAWADAPHKWPSRSRSAPAPVLPVPTLDPIEPQPTALAASDSAADPASRPSSKPSSLPKASDPDDSPDKEATASLPKPKASASKPVAKASSKPKSKSPASYTVKKGDTLYEISKRFGTPVAAIQKANGLKGSNIGIGKKLVIPRY